jgi:hypothetical protein
LIRIQGAVRDEAGKPLSAGIGITFTLYKDQNGQDSVWQESQIVQPDSTGHYSALLGASSGAGLPLEIFSTGEARWLGIRPDGQAEQPRILLLSVAYALKAADTEMLGGKPASAFVLADSYSQGQLSSGSQAGSANSQSGAQTPAKSLAMRPLDGPLTPCTTVTSTSGGTANQVPVFAGNCDIESSAIYFDPGSGNVGIGNTSPQGALDVTGTTFIEGLLTAMSGAILPATGIATSSQGFVSNPLDLQASTFSAGSPANYLFRWQAEPVGNNTGSPAGSLNLLYGAAGNSPSETGLSIASNGQINFAAGQTFPGNGNGTVTSVATNSGLTGGPITTTGTIGIATAGVTNAMLAHPSVTVVAGSGLSGGGTVALGGTITLTNLAPSSGGTVTSVGSGAGLLGGPVTTSGTLRLDTSFTDALYLSLGGGTLTGGLFGTTAAFSGNVTAAGALLPPTGVATSGQGFVSNPVDLAASTFGSGSAANYLFRWEAEPTGNNTASPSSSLNLLFGAAGNSPSETGLSIASNGLINFASGQTFPGNGNGTVTNVATGAGLTGGPITSTGTISIPSLGVTNAMLAHPSVTVVAGTGLSGGGTVALGSTITLTNTAPSLGGTVTSVGSGAGLLGGPVTTSGSLSLDTSFTDALYLSLGGGTLTGGLTGTTAAFSGGLSATTGTFSGPVFAAGDVLPPIGTATATQGFNSNVLDLQASSFNSTSSSAVHEHFRWQAEPTGNDTASPSGSLNLLFSSGANTPAETGFSIASNGLINFAAGQTFPGNGNGTVTNVATGAGLTGGPITSTGTISIPSLGVTNAMLAHPSVTVVAGTGLSGGGTVALGSTITLTNTAPSLGGTVTSVGSGAGILGGPVTTSGTLSLDTSFTDALYLSLGGGALTGGLTGTTAAFSGGLSASSGTFGGAVSASGDILPPTGTATAAQGFNSNVLDLQASSFDSTSSSAVHEHFRWQAEPTGNDTASPSGSLNLLFSSGGSAPAETGLSVASNGLINFADGQTFPGTGTGNGTVTNVATGAGLTGGPISTTGTISIPSLGVTNAMLAHPSVTVVAGSGLSGGGTVALGSTITLTNTAPSLGGTVTSVGTGTGLLGGPVTTNGTLSLDTSFTDGRYLQLAGGSLTGGLGGTTAAFSGAVSAAGDVLPPVGTATSTQGFNSNAVDLQASSFNSTSSSAVPQHFRWQAEPTGNNSSSPSGTLNLLFASDGNTPGETGLFIASNGRVNFAAGQTFPGTGNGTVTNVATGAGLSGGPISSTGTISIANSGVTNTMLANPSVTVVAGSGLSGGGLVALGGTITINNAAPSSGGTVTSVATGTGLLGGTITGAGTLSLNTGFTDARYLQLAGGTLTGGLGGTTAAFSGGLSASTGTFAGTVSAAGAALPPTGTATTTQGFNSNALDLQASAFNSSSSTAVLQHFRWQAEPTGNNSSSPSGTLNLLYASDGSAPGETGLSIANNGLVNFAAGQSFPGTGTVTNVATGSGLLGGPISSTGTISIAPSGVTNGMLANPSLTVAAGSGLSGGGTVPLGGTGTISIANLGVTNAMLAHPSVTVVAGSGLSGGGTVALGNTITLTNTAPSLGGTVTSVASGTGILGGTITGAGTLSLDTGFTDSRYLQLAGGNLSGGLTGTTASFNGTVSAAGAVLPPTGIATTSQGFNSNPMDLEASAFNASQAAPLDYLFRWQAEPSGNNSTNSGATLNLLFGVPGSIGETGLSVAANGILNFAAGQPFPGTGAVTSVGTGAGLTGGPITKSGTINIATAGVTNAMLANSSITVTPGSGLTGGGTVPLGGTSTIGIAPSGVSNAMLANASITVAPGSGLTGGGMVPLGGTSTFGIANLGVTNAMLAHPSITVVAGTGLSGGGTVALGNTITLTNTAPSLGGTVTSVAGGTGLSGGTITGAGTLSLNTGFTDARYLQLGGGALTGDLTVGGTVSAAGALFPPTGTATATKGFNSNPVDIEASVYNTSLLAPANYLFRWQAEPSGNDSASSGATLNLLYGVPGSIGESGLSVAGNGILNFASGQTFPNTGSGSVTSVAAGAGLSGGTITKTGTIGIANAGVTNAMLANPSVTVVTPTGSGLSGGGTVALGGTITLTNTAPSSGGTVTSVASGAGLSGGTITKTGTIGIAAGGVTNAMLATPSITVVPGAGLSGGGTVALGGSVTLTNSAGGTVTSVASGAGLTGGTITKTGTIGIAAAGVTNAMLATPSITVVPGTGLSGGGKVSLGGSVTLNNTGVTSVAAGAGLTGGTITKTGTIGIAPGGVFNTMLAHPMITVLTPTGSGLSGGGTVPLGGTITLKSTSTGTVTSVGSGNGLIGGPVTTNGILSLDTSYTDGRYLQRTGGTLQGGLVGTTADFSSGLTAQTGTFSEAVQAAGVVLTPTGTATVAQGYVSNPMDLEASAFNTNLLAPASFLFRWQAEPTGNNTASSGASLNLLFGVPGHAIETGLSIAKNGIITFAPNQTFTGGGAPGTVTNVATGAGLTGGPITTTGTVSIAPSGVTNAMLAHPSITVVAGTGLSGGGTVALGSSITLNNAAPAVVVTMPYFATGGARTDTVQAATLNVNKVWGILLPYNVTSSEITFDITTADNTANKYDIGIFNSTGALVAGIGAIAGTTFAPATGFRTLKWTQGSVALEAGKYYLALTTNCASKCAQLGAATSFVSFEVNASAGTSTGGALPATMTVPADAWGAGVQPTVVINK